MNNPTSGVSQPRSEGDHEQSRMVSFERAERRTEHRRVDVGAVPWRVVRCLCRWSQGTYGTYGTQGTQRSG